MPDPTPQNPPYTDEHLCVDSYYEGTDDDDDPPPAGQPAEQQPVPDDPNRLTTCRKVAPVRLGRPPRARGIHMRTNMAAVVQLAPVVAQPAPGISTNQRAPSSDAIKLVMPPVKPSAALGGIGGGGDAAGYAQPGPAIAPNSSTGELGAREDQSVLGRRRSRSPSPAFDHIPRARMDDGAYQPRPRGVLASGGTGHYECDRLGRTYDPSKRWMDGDVNAAYLRGRSRVQPPTGDYRPRCEGPTTLPTVRVQSGLLGRRSAATVCEHIVEDNSGARGYWLTPEEMENMKREREAVLREGEPGAGVTEENVL